MVRAAREGGGGSGDWATLVAAASDEVKSGDWAPWACWPAIWLFVASWLLRLASKVKLACYGNELKC
jgi:hypothetical protein